MKEVSFYWLPHCSTCQKAKDFLESAGIKIGYLHDLKKHPLTSDEVQKLAELAGGAEKMFSRRAIKYRQLELNKRSLDEKEIIDLMSGEYTFIKRPVVVFKQTALCGFSQKEYQRISQE